MQHFLGPWNPLQLSVVAYGGCTTPVINSAVWKFGVKNFKFIVVPALYSNSGPSNYGLILQQIVFLCIMAPTKLIRSSILKKIQLKEFILVLYTSAQCTSSSCPAKKHNLLLLLSWSSCLDSRHVCLLHSDYSRVGGVVSQGGCKGGCPHFWINDI